ncbi:unnamed protein product [Owenia fusiformis]|uniref:Hexosyltransferase n=1 Tax=Owenia fusiformis TaxID=6347 RepID=A0A8J1U5C4_OWEFU|nr:unnamed protein product [Owenia fusiformis]
MKTNARILIIFTVFSVFTVNLLFYKRLDFNNNVIMKRRYAVEKRMNKFFVDPNSELSPETIAQSKDMKKQSNSKRSILTMNHNEENGVRLNSNPINKATNHFQQRIMNSDERGNRVSAKRRSIRHIIADQRGNLKRSWNRQSHILRTQMMPNSPSPRTSNGSSSIDEDITRKYKSIAQTYRNPLMTTISSTLDKSDGEKIVGKSIISDNDDVNSPIIGINASETRKTYKYLINPYDICNIPASEGPYVLILVLSKPEHFDRRNAIRETWGNIARTKYSRLAFAAGKLVRVVFVLGISNEPHWKHFIQSESATYRDVLQGDILEDYRNLTHKSLLALGWVTESCSTVNFIVKSDDDTFINIPFLVKTLKKQINENVLIGALNPHSKVPRQGLWKTTRREWPGDYFPPYCSGVAYAMSTRTAMKLMETPSVPLIHLEDVYITGILAKAASIEPKGVEGFSFWISNQLNVCDIVQDKILTSHHITPHTMHDIWSQLKNKSVHSKSNCRTVKS